MKNLVAFLFVCVFATSAKAGLMLDIYEDINNNVVLQFSGSDFVTQGNSTYARNGFWFGDISDNIYSGLQGGYDALTSSFLAENITQGTSSLLDDVYFNGGFAHELGIRLGNFGILTGANNGDQISWSGMITLNLNFADFMQGIWTGGRLVANGSDELILRDGYTINIGRQQAQVPEPTSIALLGLGLAAFGFSRKKKAV